MDSFRFSRYTKGARYQAKRSQPCGISNTRTNILNLVSDLMQDTAVQSMRLFAPAPGRGELLPPQRAGELRQLAGVRLAGLMPGPPPVAACSNDFASTTGGRRLPSGYPPRLPQHPEVACRIARARFSLTWREEDISAPTCFLYPHQGVPLPGIGGGSNHGQAVPPPSW